MGGAGTGTPTPANTDGVEYGQVDIGTTPEVPFSESQETAFILARSDPNNGDDIFWGWDDSVDSNSGIVLQAGEDLSMGLNVEDQSIYFVSSSGTQTLHIASMK